MLEHYCVLVFIVYMHVSSSVSFQLKCSGDLGEDALQLAQQRVMILASCPSIHEEERLLTFEWVNIALLYTIMKNTSCITKHRMVCAE